MCDSARTFVLFFQTSTARLFSEKIGPLRPSAYTIDPIFPIIALDYAVKAK